MKIPFGTITITDKSKKLVKSILDSGRVSSGKYVREFEKRFAELVGAKEAVAVSTGTDADALALAVLHDLGAKRGDEIIIPALTFVATANAVLQAGFKPVFVDIRRDTLNIDTSKIEQAVTERTRAIMPVHLMGKPADMDPINDIAKRHNLMVIGDAAEAHGAEYKGRNVGVLGDMVAYSLYVAHIISTVEGGIITTDNADYAEILRSLRSHGRACKCESCVINTSSGVCSKRFKYGDNTDIRFMFERVGYSSKMNELEAAIGIGNLDLYDNILGSRRENHYYMINTFRRFDPHLRTIEKEPNEEMGSHAFPIILGESAKFSRNQLVEHLSDCGIDSRNLFTSIPTQTPAYQFMGYRAGEFPESEYVGNNGVHIGVHQDMGRKECDYVLKTIEGFLHNNA